MRVLVTGGTGFVGSHLVEALIARGHHVKALVRPSSNLKWLAGLPITLSYGDVEDPDSLREALQQVDWLFHVAGVTKALNHAAYMAANAEGTRNMMEACLHSGTLPQKVVLISSLSAAGPCGPDQPNDSSVECRPVSHYGMSKLLSERIARSYAERLSLVVLRPPAVYGPRDRDMLSIFRLIKRGWYLKVGRGERFLCMLHVRDLVEASILAAESDVPSGATYMLSDGQVHTWDEMVELLQEVMDVKATTLHVPIGAAWIAACLSEWVSRIRGVPPLLNRQKLREMRQIGWTCNIDKTVEQLAFQPKIALDVGLKETFVRYRENGWL